MDEGVVRLLVERNDIGISYPNLDDLFSQAPTRLPLTSHACHFFTFPVTIALMPLLPSFGAPMKKSRCTATSSTVVS